MRFKGSILFLLFLFSLSPATSAQKLHAIVDEYPVIRGLTESSVRYVDQLNNRVSQLLLDGRHRDYPGMFLAEDWDRFLWFKGFEVTTLAAALPYLSDHNRTELKTFLEFEVQNYLLDKPYREYELRDEGATHAKFPGAGSIRWWQWRSVEYEALYGLWAYAQYAGDWTLILDNWAAIREIKDNISGPGYSKRIIADSPGVHQQAVNSIISGKIAYGRMAKKLYALTRDVTYDQEYQQILAELPADLSAVESVIDCGYLECQVGWDEIISGCLANLAQLDFLTPSLARWYAENHLSGVQAVIDDAEMRDPWWFMASYNIMPGAHTLGNDSIGDFGAGCGEGYFQSPLYAYQIFQGKARVLSTPISELIAQFPVATTSKTIPIYWDMLNYANLTALIERIEGVTWIDSNTPPAVRLSKQPSRNPPMPG